MGVSVDDARRVYVVGGGPGGLAAAAELRRRGLQPVVLERGEQVGTSWRAGYDRLHLHTVRALSGLPGFGIPRAAGRWASRDAVIDYLERYRAHHDLEVRANTEVERITAAGTADTGARAAEDGDGSRWVIHTTGGEQIKARSIVVATGHAHTPFVPDWPGREAYSGELRHAREYRNPGPYAGLDVLVVGVGNSGAEIATDLGEGGARKVWIAVRTPPQIVMRQVAGWRRHPATLSLRDPFLDRAVHLGDREVPLAGDRTTPMAVQVAQGSMPTLEMTGLFDSDFKRPGVEAGLYLLRPYEPGKIPVVLVHGLFSSPRAFLQTMNELENDPEIARRYQFWVFLYPTGQPIPTSAAKLRASLHRIREALDPNYADHSMDRTVLIGHSMGGILAKMMAQDTGLVLWDAAFRRPPRQLLASAEVHRVLDEALIFQPMPFVKRVVFIATPHRGSPIADQWFGRTVASLIHRTDEQAEISKEIVEMNGPGLIAPELRPDALECDRQPPDRQPDPQGARRDPDRPGGAVPLDHPPDRRGPPHRRRRALSQLAPRSCGVRADRPRHAFLAARPGRDRRGPPDPPAPPEGRARTPVGIRLTAPAS